MCGGGNSPWTLTRAPIIRSKRLEELDEIRLLGVVELKSEDWFVVVDHRAVVLEAAIVIEASFLAREKSLQRRGAVGSRRRPIRVEIVDADCCAFMQLVPRLRIQWRHVAGRAHRLAIEYRLAASRLGNIKRSSGSLRRRN